MIALSLAAYLDILGKATAEDGPFKYDHEEAEANVLNAAFAELAKGFVTFVTVAKPIIGYDAVRSMLEDVVHTFPATEESDAFEAIQAALLAALGLTEEEAKELLDVDE